MGSLGAYTILYMTQDTLVLAPSEVERCKLTLARKHRHPGFIKLLMANKDMTVALST